MKISNPIARKAIEAEIEQCFRMMVERADSHQLARHFVDRLQGILFALLLTDSITLQEHQVYTDRIFEINGWERMNGVA